MELSILFPQDTQTAREGDIHEIHPFSTYNSQTSRGREVHAIVAMARDGAIGRGGTLPWRLPEDMAHFKASTMGRPVIMGRKTWESLPKRPLPGRRNIVISRNSDYQAEGAEVYNTLAEAIAACDSTEVPVIIGGAGIYSEAMPYLTRLVITQIDTDVPDADVFFPAINPNEWNVSEAGDLLESKTGLRYKFLTLTRK